MAPLKFIDIPNSKTEEDEVFVVSCYSDFEKLAHGPRGNQASQSLRVYRFQPAEGTMVLLNVTGDPKEVMNPAFSRFHPSLNVLYTCTEDISENGQIFAYKINTDGELTQIGKVDAGGTSTCYLTIDRDRKHLLAVNYWDSTLVSIPICPETGAFTGPVISKYDPKCGMMIKSLAKKDGGVNHSNNDESTIKMRQADPHSHALVLDPYFGCLAYVPCLGKDLVREFFYDKTKGVIDTELNFLPSGLCTGHPDGPRYLEFHPTHNTMYVVNELSSTVAVFSVNKALIREINIAAKNGECLDRFKGQSTLTLIQSISTLPNAFPKKLNTCGRIALHKSGNFLLVSNRGHQSIAIMRVKSQGSKAGQLSLVGNFHTRGETPRHFQFDHSGQYLIVANQDTDNLAIFHFNQSSGTIKFTGNEYRIPSPNFVCCCKIHEDFIDRDQFNLKSSDVTVMTDASSTNESPVGSVDGNEELTTRKIMLEEQLMKTLAEVERLKREISQIDL